MSRPKYCEGKSQRVLKGPRGALPHTIGGYGDFKILNNGGEGLKNLSINGWVRHNRGAGGRPKNGELLHSKVILMPEKNT